MSLWSSIAGWFARSPADSGFLVRDGHQLRWDKADLPIDIILHPSALAYEGPLVSAVRALNGAVGDRLYLFPVVDMAESMRLAWIDPIERKRIKRTIVVMGNETFRFGDRHVASTDFRYDNRSGRIFNAELQFPPREVVVNALGEAYMNQMCQHELCHGVGLDHDQVPTSIMWPQLRPEATMLLGTDIARLRAAYK